MLESQIQIMKASCAKQLIELVATKEEPNAVLSDLDFQMLNVAGELLLEVVGDPS